MAQRNRLIVLVATSASAVFAVGIALAAANATPKTFWTSIGFLMAGTAIAVGTTIFLVERVLRNLQQERDNEARVKILRDIGGDCLGAIQRGFVGIFGMRGPTLNEQPLAGAWRLGIQTGNTPADGLRDTLSLQYQQTVYTEEELHSKNPPRERTVLSNSNKDFDIALVMVLRALGKAYARLELFELEDLPINSLERASWVLRDGKDNGVLSDFEGSVLISHLSGAAEKCGKLLWELGIFN